MLRLFVAIPLPNEMRTSIKERARQIGRQLTHIHDLRLIPEENWHLTLVFLGHQHEACVPRLVRALDAAAMEISLSEISFSRIIFGPQGPAARMMWAETTIMTSHKLGLTRTILEKYLVQENVVWDKDTRPYHGHLTLARFHPILKKRLPPIEVGLNFEFQPESISLMKSTLTRRGADYETIFKVKIIKSK